ncbi:hypothetical protein RI367_000040 [Sorochytrium milnesiophthora]
MGGTGGPSWWGNLSYPHAHQRNIIAYAVSPFRQRAFAGAMKKGLFNVWRRTSQQAPYIIPPVLLGYAMYKYSSDKYAYYHTKAGAHEAGGH